MTMLTVVAGAQFIMRKKLRAQALCVRKVASLQNNLGRNLNELVKLNPEAARLRVRRAQADQRLANAVGSANPYAIVLAEAAHTAVILQQLNLRARQWAILAEAEGARLKHDRDLRYEARVLTGSPVFSKHGHAQALAVQAVPAGSLTPDYRPLANFEIRQRHTYEFKVPLSPEFLRRSFQQTTICSATLGGKEGSWSVRLTEASALSKRP